MYRSKQEKANLRGMLSLGFGLTLALIVVFCALLTVFVFARDLCCADDASFAVVSKNLAQGRGYTLTLQYYGPDYSGRKFEPLLGSGPTLNIPVAVAIKLFGPSPWVPGLTQVVQQGSLVLLIAVLCARWAYKNRLPFAFLVFFATVVVFSAYHFEQWYAQLGETIAALLIIAGFLSWASISHRAVAAAVTGGLLGLAVLTKELAGLYVVVFLFVAGIYRLWIQRSRPIVKEDIQVLVVLALAGSLPLACFEIWKLASLGLHGYFLNWHDHLDFLLHQPRGIERSTVAELLVERAQIFRERFFIAPALVFGLMGIAVGLVMWSQDRVSQAIAIYLTVAIIAHAVYWVFISNGWPRYAYIGVICWCFLLTVPVLTGMSVRVLVTYVGLLLFIAAFSIPKFEYQVELLRKGLPPPSPTLRSAQHVLAFLDAHTPGQIAFVQWWAHAAALEYLSVSPSRFRGYQLANQTYTNQTWYIVVDKRFLNADDHEFRATLEKCGAPVLRSQPYELFSCSP